jgi:hypothetical protein
MASEKKCGAYVAIHHLVVFFSTGVDQVFVVSNANVVDQDIQGSKLLFCCGNGPDRCLFISDISGYCYGSTTRGLDRLHKFIETFLSPGNEDKVSSFAG